MTSVSGDDDLFKSLTGINLSEFETRWCRKCESDKPLYNFQNGACGDCSRARKAEIRRLKAEGIWVRPEADLVLVWEKQAEALRLAKNRRRALKFGGGTEPYTEADVLERWGTCCHLCGEEVDLDAPRSAGKIGWERGLHLEHVIDLALGGSDTVENVKPSHGKCNLKKPRK